MTISSVFIRRPRLAFVVSTVITIAGLHRDDGAAGRAVPRHRAAAGPVTATYPGASAQAVEESVAQVIEAQVNGVERMIYMKSTSGGDGSYSLTVSFAVGSDPDLNTVNVTNRVNQALALLPPEVQRHGRDHQEAVVGAAAGHRRLLAQGQPRRAVPVELRHHQPARLAEARAGRRRRRAVRPARLLDARLAQARPHVEPRHHAQRRGQGGAVAERPGRRRPGRRRAADGRRRLPAQHHHPGPPDRRSRSSRTSSCAPRPTARWCASRTSAGSSSAPRPAIRRPATTASPRPASRSTSCPAPMRWRPRRRCARR